MNTIAPLVDWRDGFVGQGSETGSPSMTPFRALALALCAVLAACDVAGPTVNLAPDCPRDDSSFNRDLGMQPAPNACPPRH